MANNTARPRAKGKPAPAQVVPAEVPGGCLHVQARTDGFRRAGRAWSAAGEVIRIADYTEDQIKALHAEPELIVTDHEDQP